MKRFLLWVGVVCWCVGSGAHAAEAVDDFVKAYGLIQQADALQAGGQGGAAREKYQQAHDLLQTLRETHPDWNPKVIQFRLNYVAKKLEALPPPAPTAASLPPAAAPTPPAGPAPELQQLQQVVARAEARIQQLESQRTVLEARLREALTAQPAAVDPRALARAEARVLELQKENDLLKVTLQQEQARFTQAIAGTIQQQAQTELTAAREQLARQAETLQALQQERDLLQQRLQALEAQTQTAHAELADENTTLRQQLAEREALQRSLQLAETQLAAERALTEKLRAQNDALEQKVAELIALRNINADGKTIDLTPPAVSPEEHTRLLLQVARLREDLQAAQRDAAEQRGRAQQLAEANAELETRLRALARRQQEASAATDQFEQRLSRAQADLAAAQARLNEAQGRADQLASANQALEAQLRLAHLALASDNSRDGRARLGAQLAVLQQQLTTERARASKLLAEKTALEQRVGELEAESAAAQARVASLQEQLQAARAEAAAARALVAQLQAAVAELEQQRRAWDQEHARLDIKLASAAPGLPAGGSDDAQKIRQLEEQREQLQRRVQELTEALHLAHEQADVDKSDELKQQIEALQARLAAYEAQRVPYTAEELALFNKPGASPPPETRQAAAPAKPLPPEAQKLVEAARSAFAAGRYDEAAEYSRKVLEFDENNAVALVNLAAIEIEQRRFDEAEPHLRKALAVQPNDAHALSQFGYLKFLQEQPDAAIEALSRAVKLEPDRAEFQNYLGLALNQKGLRAQAESALRRAVQLSPGYASAHYNLAVLYAKQQPPFGALARWHYQRALQAGHPPNAELEALLESLRHDRAPR